MQILLYLYETFMHWFLEVISGMIMHYGCPASSRTAKLQIRKKIFKV